MFWVLLLLPFVLLGLAAVIAKKGPVVRSVLVLALIFLVIDGFAIWELMSDQASTGSIGLGMLGLLQLVIAVALLIASPFARKAWKRTKAE